MLMVLNTVNGKNGEMNKLYEMNLHEKIMFKEINTKNYVGENND